MTIEEKDFKLVYDSDRDRFDLSIVRVINAKDPEKRREELTIFGYSMTEQGALGKIIRHRLSQKRVTYTWREYLNAFSEERKKLSRILEAGKSNN